jgi:hypothetical protein
MAQEWDIQARGDACSVCEKPFEDRQVCYSTLLFDAEGYRRMDVCETCCSREQPPNAVFSTWQGVYRLPPPGPEEPLKKETAESLLRRLIEAEDESQADVIYILAVMLERKRLLTEKDVQPHESGSLVRVYEHRKTGETFLISDPRLQLDQLEDVQQKVVAMLGGSDSPSPPEPQPAGEDGPEAETEQTS